MPRWLIPAGAGVLALGAAALAARRGCAGARSGFDFGKMVERMPENAPPKWMFRNITAIRENTEHILELLEQERVHEPEPEAAEPVR